MRPEAKFAVRFTAGLKQQPSKVCSTESLLTSNFLSLTDAKLANGKNGSGWCQYRNRKPKKKGYVSARRYNLAMKPLLKWPGGKGSELSNIRPLIPPFKRFVEPFAGGGAVFFDLEPQKAVINDINPQLTSFYQLISKDPVSFEKTLRQYDTLRNNANLWGESVADKILKLYRGASAQDKFLEILQKNSPSLMASWAKISKSNNFGASDNKQIYQAFEKSIANKLTRIRNYENKNQSWINEDIKEQIVTAAHAGVYTWIRDTHTPSNQREKSSQFLYLREFCYGSMFRFNKEGHFNIPYGGKSYNDKDFSRKINSIFEKSVIDLLSRTEVTCKSFDDLSFKADDFVFLDPPYDSEFSDYDQFSFGREEQTSLASTFANLPCPALMIIGKTDFIEKLYKQKQKENKNIVIEEYEKTYAYNVRGRNNRQITHLAIRNYALASEKTS